MVHVTDGLIAQDFSASLYMFSLSFPLFVTVHLCPLLFILLVQKAAPIVERNRISVHQFKFLRSRAWLARPTCGPWTTFSTLSSHLWSEPGNLHAAQIQSPGKRARAGCVSNHMYCVWRFTQQWPSVMGEESSGQLRLVTIQLPSSLKAMLMRSLEKNKGWSEVAVRVAVAQSCPHEVLFSVIRVEDTKKRIWVHRLIPSRAVLLLWIRKIAKRYTCCLYNAGHSAASSPAVFW